jgi:hypothetical protein
MDTTFITILLVLFLVIAGLAIDVGYLYVDEEALQHTAESAALAGAQSLKQRLLTHVQKDPAQLEMAAADPVQSAVRAAARETASGRHDATALVELANDNTNALGSDNDITVGFWNFSAHRYTPGGKPVNAVQVRARRTAESSTVGMGNIGAFLSRISGIDSHNYTPIATAAIPTRARPGFVLAAGACDQGCTFPRICNIPERKLTLGGWGPGSDATGANRFVFSSLRYQLPAASAISSLVCNDAPAQMVCGKPVYLAQGSDGSLLRDLESAMYNPEHDRSNKESDPATGQVTGWWVIVPMTASAPTVGSGAFAQQPVSRYALVRISRICADGPPGCGQKFDAPAAKCSSASMNGLFIDRISCVGCDDSLLVQRMPGLQPMLVK